MVHLESHQDMVHYVKIKKTFHFFGRCKFITVSYSEVLQWLNNKLFMIMIVVYF